VVLEPLENRRADLVIGSRVRGGEPGSLGRHQRAGNLVATTLIRALYHHHYTDLGPLRAIRWQALAALGMRDPGYGWLVEMQVRALRIGLRIEEVPVHYRRRAGGNSKVSGTFRGSALAGGKVLYTILRYATAR
jgi:hypothetical protein